MTTALAEDELLVEARLPLLAADARCGFYEFSRRAGDYALAMALVTYRLEDGVIVEPRVGVGGAETAAATHRRGGAGARGPAADRCRLPRGGGCRRGRESIRWRTCRRTPNIAATSCAP